MHALGAFIATQTRTNASRHLGIHVAASPIPAGYAVDSPQLRTPMGPSAIFSRGQPSSE